MEREIKSKGKCEEKQSLRKCSFSKVLALGNFSNISLYAILM